MKATTKNSKDNAVIKKVWCAKSTNIRGRFKARAKPSVHSRQGESGGIRGVLCWTSHDNRDRLEQREDLKALFKAVESILSNYFYQITRWNLLGGGKGKFITVDEATTKQQQYDMARAMVYMSSRAPLSVTKTCLDAFDRDSNMKKDSGVYAYPYWCDGGLGEGHMEISELHLVQEDNGEKGDVLKVGGPRGTGRGKVGMRGRKTTKGRENVDHKYSWERRVERVGNLEEVKKEVRAIGRSLGVDIDNEDLSMEKLKATGRNKCASMEGQDMSPPHMDTSRPSLGFPLGTALLLIIIFSLSGIFSCCYHWDKLRSFRQSLSLPLPTTPSSDLDLDLDLDLNKTKAETLPVLMPGDQVPKFIAIPSPCQPHTTILLTLQNPPPKPPLTLPFY
ncbi:hypothetical protein VNO78_08859 [Psophocarpus tetragonolobus]|uniref:Uncharacterized protein n=1 Tax=Psophocarpus tetragonolobus TaxID=3891 RepID=A0AAN9XT85_PSOTE